MSDNLGLKENNIAVITGGIRGSNGDDAKGTRNWPDEAFSCAAVDIIALHGFVASHLQLSASAQILLMLDRYFRTPADEPWVSALS